MVNVVDRWNRQVSIIQIKETSKIKKDKDLSKKADALDLYVKSKQIDQNVIETILFDMDKLKLHYVQIDDKYGTSDIDHEIIIPYFIDTIVQLNQLLQSYTAGQIIIQQLSPVSINRWACDKLAEADAIKIYRVNHKINILDLTELQLKDDYDNLKKETCIDQESNGLFDSLQDRGNFEISKLKINNSTIENRTNIEYLFQHLIVDEIDFGDANLDNYDSWEGLFYGSEIKSLDLTKYNGNKVKQLKKTFAKLEITKKLDIQTLWFDSLRDMDGTFMDARVPCGIKLHRHEIETIRQNKGPYDEEPDFCMYQTFLQTDTNIIDLTDFSMYLVRDMDSAFGYCIANEVKFGHQELPFIRSMQDIFSDCTIQKIDIENLSIPCATLTDMQNMFYEARIPRVVLSNINTDELSNMNGFLYQATIKTFDMRNIDTSNVILMKDMFNDSNFKVIVTDGRTLGFKSIEDYKKASINELNSIVRQKYSLNMNDLETRVCYAQLDTSKVQDAMQFIGSLTNNQNTLKVFDFSYNNTDKVKSNWNFIDMKDSYYYTMITFKMKDLNGNVRYNNDGTVDREWNRISDRFDDKDNSNDINIKDSRN